jgi:hypothetical protein
MPGIVAALWVAWPCFVLGLRQRQTFVHPKAYIYNGSTQDNFEQLSQLLRESAYKFGDHWNIVTADTQTNRLLANLHFFDEISQLSANGGLRTEKLRRFIQLEATFKDVAPSKSLIQLNFDKTAEGRDLRSCEEIIQEVVASFHSRIGVGESYHIESPVAFPAPPWWLIVVTSFSLLGLGWQIVGTILGNASGVISIVWWLLALIGFFALIACFEGKAEEHS